MDRSSAAITPPTEEEINRFCEEANVVRPDPNDYLDAEECRRIAREAL